MIIGIILSSAKKWRQAFYPRKTIKLKPRGLLRYLSKWQRRLVLGNQAYLSADRAVKSVTGVSPLLLMGATLVADVRGKTYTPTELGNLLDAKISGIKLNKLLAENGLQYKDDNGDWIPTKLSDGMFEWVDTAKQHSNGSPIKQLRWFKDILEKIG